MVPAQSLSHAQRPAWRQIMWAVMAVLLLAPAVSMLFTHEVRWGAEDFAAAAILLGAVGIGVELAMRFVTRALFRGLACAAIFGAALLLWAQAAVGIF